MITEKIIDKLIEKTRNNQYIWYYIPCEKKFRLSLKNGILYMSSRLIDSLENTKFNHILQIELVQIKLEIYNNNYKPEKLIDVIKAKHENSNLNILYDLVEKNTKKYIDEELQKILYEIDD